MTTQVQLPDINGNAFTVETDPATGAFFSQPIQGGSAVAVSNPLPVDLVNGGTVIGVGNPVPVDLVNGGTVVGTGNPLPVGAAQTGTWAVGQAGTWNVGQAGTWTVSQGGIWAIAQSGAWAINQAGTWNIGNITGTISLPTGAATAAAQATLNASVGPAAPGTAAGSSVLVAAIYSGTPPAPSTGQQLALRADAVGRLIVASEPTSMGGCSVYRIQSAASTNAADIKASPGQVYTLDIGNTGTVDAFVKLFNKASPPTPGTDTPDFIVYSPKGTARAISFPGGLTFGTGLAIAITAGAADSDTTAVAANQIVGVVGYS